MQEELARRTGKRKVKQKGTTTEQGKYSSKYALTELLICGECGTPYRRCTWTASGKKKIVWRCINRLDFGKKYCHNSPTIEESVLQEAIMEAIKNTAQRNTELLTTLKLHIGMGLESMETEDRSLAIQVRIAEINAEFKELLGTISADTADSTYYEQRMGELSKEKQSLEAELKQYADAQERRDAAKSRMDEIAAVIDTLVNHPMTFDDRLVRQVLECVVVESKDAIKVVFKGGCEVMQSLTD